MRRTNVLIVSLSTLSCAASDGDATRIASRRENVIYGSDDRHDVHAEPSAELRTLARATAALIKPQQLRFSGSSDVELRAAPLGVWDRYCAGTPFLDQPTAARCGAVLIDDDLVLTAGHCLDDVARCSDYAYVFDYLYASPGEIGPLLRNGVYACRRVAARETSAPDADELVDFAVLQLDRPASAARPPAAVGALAALSSGDALSVVGFPNGLPAKIDSGAVVVEPRPATLDFFSVTSDTFSGSSGSGVYDVSHTVVGLLARGGADLVDQGACRALRRLNEDPNSPGEQATYAARAIEALCKAGWPSERLCGIRPRCGDGVCSVAATPATPAETPELCSADCASANCGDGLCEQLEWDGCPEDCGDRRPPGLADAWYCEPEWYADGHTCDCECGATDPDCASNGKQLDCQSAGPAGLEPHAIAAPPAADTGCAVSPTRSIRARNAGLTAAWLSTMLAALAAIRRRTRRPPKSVSACRRARPCDRTFALCRRATFGSRRPSRSRSRGSFRTCSCRCRRRRCTSPGSCSRRCARSLRAR